MDFSQNLLSILVWLPIAGGILLLAIGDDDDLKSLAAHHVEQGAQLHRVRYGEFSGFYVHYQAEENLWYEWWLRAGLVALHASYYCGLDDRSKEEASIAWILGSLRLHAP